MATNTDSAEAEMARVRQALDDGDTMPAPPLTLREQVSEFHEAMGQPIRLTPSVPSRDRVQLRLRLIAEEFFELVEACDAPTFALTEAIHWTKEAIAGAGTPADVNLVKAADALADIDYVVEGTRLEFGINGEPIADAVHRSNMTKRGGSIVNGKVMKPPGFAKADIAAELRAQGWDGES